MAEKVGKEYSFSILVKRVNQSGPIPSHIHLHCKTKILADQFATEYESTVVLGIASEVKDEERHTALRWIVEKYSPPFLEEGKHYIEQKEKAVKVFKIEIIHISGKARR